MLSSSLTDRQEAVKLRLMREMSQCTLGKAYGITAKNTATWHNLPVATYDQLRSEVAPGKPLPYTRERVLQWTQTTGSGSQPKLIPLTPSLRNCFQKLFLLWLKDVAFHRPSIILGRSFLSVSPDADTRDEDYVSPIISRFLDKFVIHIPSLKSSRDAAEFHSNLEALLEAKDLRAISIWSPSYLLNFLAYLSENQGLKDSDFADIWPKLQFISCWGDASAERGFLQLKALFPNAKVQPKGLLSTEGPLTFPLWNRAGGLPLIDNVYYEFRSNVGKIKTLAELRPDEHYEVIPSWPGGFVRYDLKDRIELVGWRRDEPLLRFVGRSGVQSDWVGEKVTESFVRSLLDRERDRLGLDSFIVPLTSVAGRVTYALVTSSPAIRDVPSIDSLLRRNPNYDWARKFGQLEEAFTAHVRDPQRLLLEACAAAGQCRATIKPAHLVTNERVINEVGKLLRKHGLNFEPAQCLSQVQAFLDNLQETRERVVPTL